MVGVHISDLPKFFISIHGITSDFSPLVLIKFASFIFGQERLNQINRGYWIFIGGMRAILLGKSVKIGPLALLSCLAANESKLIVIRLIYLMSAKFCDMKSKQLRTT